MTPRTRKMASPDLLWVWTVRVQRHAGLLSAVFVVAGLVLWSTLCAGRGPRPAVSRPAVSRAIWLGGDVGGAAGTWSAGARAVASPVLFALPTPFGFSRGALDDVRRAPSLPALESDLAPTSTRPAAIAVARIERATPAELAVAARVLPWPRDDAAPGPLATAAAPALVVSWRRDGAPNALALVPAGTNAAWYDTQAWEAVARVNLDEHGWAEHVLLTKPTPVTNRNAQIVQLLRTMPFGTNGARLARVAIQYDGRAGAVRPAGEGPPP